MVRSPLVVLEGFREGVRMPRFSPAGYPWKRFESLIRFADFLNRSCGSTTYVLPVSDLEDKNYQGILF
jgi:hypothetical protein